MYPANLEKRFWKYVKKTEFGCWEWVGFRNPKGYGLMTVRYRDENNNRRMISKEVHRWSWYIHHGEFPPRGVFVCHQCDNPSCVNPTHLWLGNYSTNAKDTFDKDLRSAAKGEKCNFAKLNDLKVRVIRRLKGHLSGYETAEIFGIYYGHVYKIWRREVWAHV